VDILDVLEDDIHRNVAQVKLGRHQYSVCALRSSMISCHCADIVA